MRQKSPENMAERPEGQMVDFHAATCAPLAWPLFALTAVSVPSISTFHLQISSQTEILKG